MAKTELGQRGASQYLTESGFASQMDKFRSSLGRKFIEAFVTKMTEGNIGVQAIYVKEGPIPGNLKFLTVLGKKEQWGEYYKLEQDIICTRGASDAPKYFHLSLSFREVSADALTPKQIEKVRKDVVPNGRPLVLNGKPVTP